MNKVIDAFEAVALAKADRVSAAQPLQLTPDQTIEGPNWDENAAKTDWIDPFDLPENTALKGPFERIRTKIEEIEARNEMYLTKS
ncbi:MAG: hypothetical protein AAF429_14600 [Pseudomonadota bacterium]